MSVQITRYHARYISPDLIQVRITGRCNKISVSIITNTNSSVLKVIGKHIISKTKRDTSIPGKKAVYLVSERDVKLIERLKTHQKSYEMLRKLYDATREEIDSILDIADMSDAILNLEDIWILKQLQTPSSQYGLVRGSLILMCMYTGFLIILTLIQRSNM